MGSGALEGTVSIVVVDSEEFEQCHGRRGFVYRNSSVAV